MATIAEAAKIGLKRGGGGASEAVATQVVKAARDNHAISRRKERKILEQKQQGNSTVKNSGPAVKNSNAGGKVNVSNKNSAKEERFKKRQEIESAKQKKKKAKEEKRAARRERKRVDKEIKQEKKQIEANLRKRYDNYDYFKKKRSDYSIASEKRYQKKKATIERNAEIKYQEKEIRKKLGKEGESIDLKGISSSIRPDSRGTLETPEQRVRNIKNEHIKKREEHINKTAPEVLAKMDADELDGGGRGLLTTVKGLGGGAKDFYLDPIEGAERRKAAYRGTFQAAAVSAGGHAGIAVLNGDDPWEAAKTGAFRGALVGGGYQTLKGATGANTGSMWGNMQHIGSTTKDLYKATTIKGREEFKEKGMSQSLKTLLSTQADMKTSSAVRSTKGNTTTAQVMN